MKKTWTTLLILTLIACGQNTTTDSDTDNRKKIVDENWKTLEGTDFTIQYPEYWELDETGQMGTTFILFLELESSLDQILREVERTTDQTRENVNLLIQNLSGQNIDLDKYTEIGESQVKTMITNSSLLESKRIKGDKGEYHRMIYTGQQGQFDLKWKQYFWVINDKAYVLTFIADQDRYDNYIEIADKILNSFILREVDIAPEVPVKKPVKKPVIKENFKVVNILKKEFHPNKYSSDIVNYRFEFELKNLTNNKITSVVLTPKVSFTFKDPSYIAAVLGDHKETKRFFYDISWLPNTNIKVILAFTGNTGYGLTKQTFERTPTKAILKFEIDAECITVDYERKYEEDKVYSLIDDWKEYQKVLGLR